MSQFGSEESQKSLSSSKIIGLTKLKEFDDNKEYSDEEQNDTLSTSSQKSNEKNQKLIEDLLGELDDEDSGDDFEEKPKVRVIKQLDDKPVGKVETIVDTDHDTIAKLMESYENMPDEISMKSGMTGSVISNAPEKYIESQKEAQMFQEKLVEQQKKISRYESFLQAPLIRDISNKILAERFGSPVCFKTTKKYFCLGTDYGLVLVYHIKNFKLYSILGTVTFVQDKLGATPVKVTAMDVRTGNEEMVLVGYSNGNLTIWNIEKSSPVNVVKDVFKTPIIHCAFLNDPNMIVASDRQYQISLVSLSSMSFLTSIENIKSEIELTSQISVLPASQNGLSSVDVFNLFAIASHKKVSIFSRVSQVKEIPFDDLKVFHSQEQVHPTLAWRTVMIPNGTYNVNEKIKAIPEPRLAIGWGNNIDIYKIFKSSELGMNLEIVHERCISLNRDVLITQLSWISDSTLLAMDQFNQIMILDENVQDAPIETIDRFPISQHKVIGLATWMDDGLTVKDKKLYLNHDALPTWTLTIDTSKGTDFSFGLHCIRVNNWEQRINSLEKIGDLAKAIQFSIKCYLGQGTAVIGLPHEKREREDTVVVILERLIYAYFAEGPRKCYQTTKTEDVLKFETYTRELIDYCLQVQDSHSKIFLGLYDKYKVISEEDRFINMLEKPILEKRMSTLFKGELFEEFMNAMLMSKNVRLDSLEKCILNLDLRRLCVADNEPYVRQKQVFERLLGYLRSYAIDRPKDKKLLQAFIYYYNAIESEYIAPIRELLDSMEKTNFSIEKEVGEVVIAYCHRWIKEGRSFSDILVVQSSRVEQIKKDILIFVFGNSPNEVHWKNERLRCLLKFPKLFFKFLSSAFFSTSASSPFNDTSFYPSRNAIQDIFNTLLSKTDIQVLSPEGMVWFYEFRSESIAKKQVKFGRVDQTGVEILGREEVVLFKKIFESFCKDTHVGVSVSEAAQTKQLRQNYLITMYNQLEKANIKELMENEVAIREMSFKHHFYRFCSMLWKKIHDENWIPTKHNKVIECLLKDDSTLETKRNEVFSYITENRQEDRLPKMKDAIRDHFLELFKVDPQQATNIILSIENFDTLHLEIKAKFNAIENEKEKRDLLLKYLEIIINFEGLESKQGIVSDKSLHLDYIQLLCFERKHEVVSFLTKHPEISDVDQILEMIKTHNIAEANSYLLERKDEVGKAIETILGGITTSMESFIARLDATAKHIDPENTKWKDMVKFIQDVSVYYSLESTDEEASYVTSTRKDILTHQSNDYEYKLPLFEGQQVEQVSDVKQKVGEQLEIAVRMCERNTIRKTMDEQTMNDLWFKLMYTFYKPYQKLRDEMSGKQRSISKIVDDMEGDEKDEELRGDIESTEDDVEQLIKKIGGFKKTKDATSEAEKKKELDEKIKTAENQLKRKSDLLTKFKNELKNREEEKKRKQEELENAQEQQLWKLSNLWAQRVYFHFVMFVLRKMITIIPIPTILTKFIEELKDEEFVNIKRLLLKLHKRYKQDRGLEDTANNILKGDNFDLGKSFKKKKTQALTPKEDKCSHSNCRHKFWDDKYPEHNSIRLFDCGHAFHIMCLGDDTHECPQCTNKNIKIVTKERSKNVTGKQEQLNLMYLKQNLNKMNQILDKTSNSKMDLYEHLVVDTKKTTLRFSDGLMISPSEKKREKPGVVDVLTTYTIGKMTDVKNTNHALKENGFLDGLVN